MSVSPVGKDWTWNYENSQKKCKAWKEDTLIFNTSFMIHILNQQF